MIPTMITDVFGNPRIITTGVPSPAQIRRANKKPVKFDGLFKFDFGVLSNPHCGSAHVKGQYGRFKPKIQRPPVDIDTRTLLKDELKEWCTQFWSESPDYIDGIADITNIWTIHTNGSAPIHTEKYKISNRYIAWLWLMDDTFETARDEGCAPQNLMIAGNHILDVLSGKYRSSVETKVPSFEEVPNSRRFQEVFLSLVDVHNTCCSVMPHYQACITPLWNCFQKYYANTAWSCAEEIDGRYTEETFCHWRGIDVFIEEIFEFTALFENVFVPKEIRESTSFLRWLRVAHRIAHISNDVVGIQKELKTFDGLEGTSGNLVLFKVAEKDVPFEQAIKEACSEMDGLIGDYILLKGVMMKEHSNNPDLIKYIDIVDNVVDGNNCTYVDGKRYHTQGKVEMYWF